MLSLVNLKLNTKWREKNVSTDFGFGISCHLEYIYVDFVVFFFRFAIIIFYKHLQPNLQFVYDVLADTNRPVKWKTKTSFAAIFSFELNAHVFMCSCSHSTHEAPAIVKPKALTHPSLPFAFFVAYLRFQQNSSIKFNPKYISFWGVCVCVSCALFGIWTILRTVKSITQNDDRNLCLLQFFNSMDDWIPAFYLVYHFSSILFIFALMSNWLTTFERHRPILQAILSFFWEFAIVLEFSSHSTLILCCCIPAFCVDLMVKLNGSIDYCGVKVQWTKWKMRLLFMYCIAIEFSNFPFDKGNSEQGYKQIVWDQWKINFDCVESNFSQLHFKWHSINWMACLTRIKWLPMTFSQWNNLRAAGINANILKSISV